MSSILLLSCTTLKKGEQILNKKKNTFSLGLNIGSSSILLVFVFLCLIFFAALSIISANADNKLSRKILERTTDYYNACNEAEIFLADLDALLIENYKNSKTEAEYYAKTGYTKTYTIAISDLQSLKVEVDILYPIEDTDSFYSIKCWQVVTIEK